MSILHVTFMLHVHVSMLVVYAACPCCLSMLLVHAACTCRLSMLLVHAACPCCVSMLLVHAACPCCLSKLHVHASFPCLHAACPWCISVLHFYAFPCVQAHVNVSCPRRRPMFPCCMSICMSMLLVHTAWHSPWTSYLALSNWNIAKLWYFSCFAKFLFICPNFTCWQAKLRSISWIFCKMHSIKFAKFCKISEHRLDFAKIACFEIWNQYFVTILLWIFNYSS